MGKKGLFIDYEFCSGCHTCEIACQMEHNFPVGVFGIHVAEVGPFQYQKGEDEKWQWAYVPIPTDLCDLCEDRLNLGKLPTCVHHCQANIISYGDVEELSKELNKKDHTVLFSVE